MIDKIRRLHGKVDKQIQILRWRKESSKMHISLDACRNIREQNLGKHILVVSPHADDELIGNYGLLKTLNSSCTMFYCGLLGYDVGNAVIASTRRSEYVLFCQKMSLPYSISQGECHWLENVLEIVDQKQPDTIFLPSFWDWHWEHRRVCIEVLKILKEKQCVKNIYLYQVSVPLPRTWITDYVPMDNQLSKEKWDCFTHVYKSQCYMPLLRFQAAENVYRVNGKRIAAEVFCKIDIEAINLALNKAEGIEAAAFDRLKIHVNHLQAMRRECDRLSQR